MESRELLGLCLKSIKGLGKELQLVDACFIWTEPHSKELKVRLELQQEALVGVVVRQSMVAELRIDNLQCNDCKKSFTKHTWDSSVQVRQRSEHRRTLMVLEQLILQHKAHKQLIQLSQTKDGMDFYFTRERDAQEFVAFLKSWAVVRHEDSKKLVSHNAQNTTYRYKRTTCVEVCPVCRDDLVFLPRKIAQALGGLPPLMLCFKAASNIYLVDPATSRLVEVSANEYWRRPFAVASTPAKLTEFVVLDVVPDERAVPSTGRFRNRSGASSIVPCDIEIARASDFGRNDERITVQSHLGGLLHVGDIALGYDLRTLHIGMDEEELGGVPPLDVYLVKKKRPERTHRRRNRPGKGAQEKIAMAAQRRALAKEEEDEAAEAGQPQPAPTDADGLPEKKQEEEAAEPEDEEEDDEEASSMREAAQQLFGKLASQPSDDGAATRKSLQAISAETTPDNTPEVPDQTRRAGDEERHSGAEVADTPSVDVSSGYPGDDGKGHRRPKGRARKRGAG
eukprot:TRINITY_DN3344_c0_g1_i1.p1 TRINITY_DN3344_c0_g1~~TRINITY_DN3344_c0_g1_i1.p1  ORF type:complete len:585 (+),score=154.59 TRINITY_DN3344_c0_g1_i1:231-1757(+)